jgi:hypothetical protein
MGSYYRERLGETHEMEIRKDSCIPLKSPAHTVQALVLLVTLPGNFLEERSLIMLPKRSRTPGRLALMMCVAYLVLGIDAGKSAAPAAGLCGKHPFVSDRGVSVISQV